MTGATVKIGVHARQPIATQAGISRAVAQVLLAIILVLLAFSNARAQSVAAPDEASVAETTQHPEPPPESTPPSAASSNADLSATRKPWPIVTALVLGPIVHGAGHFVAGERPAALQLLAAEGIGLLATGIGLGGIAFSGASEKTVALFAGLSAFGAGLFGTSFLADVYGVVAPRGGFGTPVLRPAWVTEAGVFGVVDPVFDYDALAYVNTRAWLGRNSLLLEGYIGIDHDNQRLRGIYTNRFIERGAATYVEAELGIVHHRFAPERFSMTFGEAAISGRLGLDHISDTMQGAFVEGACGLAFGGHHYFDAETESDDMLLLRVGFGFFIGDGGSWTLYYDHRHDGYAAGMKMPGIASGMLGHVGTALQYYVSSAWGVAIRAETGSAHVIGASLLFRRKRW